MHGESRAVLDMRWAWHSEEATWIGRNSRDWRLPSCDCCRKWPWRGEGVSDCDCDSTAGMPLCCALLCSALLCCALLGSAQARWHLHAGLCQRGKREGGDGDEVWRRDDRRCRSGERKRERRQIMAEKGQMGLAGKQHTRIGKALGAQVGTRVWPSFSLFPLELQSCGLIWSLRAMACVRCAPAR